ncbi:hypothetical protein ACJJTC_017549 [Scirpophaga incertulas]
MSYINFENVGAFLRKCNGTTLRYDQACLEILTKEKISFWSQYEECEGCMLLETANLPATGSVILDTLSPVEYAIRNGNGEICNGTFAFREFGQYSINLTAVTKDQCQPMMTAEPDAAYLPILTAVVILLSMATIWYIVKGIGKRIVAGRLYSRFFAREDDELGSGPRILTQEVASAFTQTRSRLRSLDIFRGLCIALMIFVNAGGGGYGIFSHSVWNGLTVADVVYPWFAFAMGEALVLSLNARLRASLPRSAALCQVVRRSIVLSLIGIILSSVNVSWDNVRLPGVLQRLAAMYLIVGSLECAFMSTNQNITPGHSLFRDIAAGNRQLLATVIMVAVQVCVTLTVAAPGCPAGYMGPGGLHMSKYNVNLQNCTGGIAGYVDRLILGPSHLHKRGSFSAMYATSVPHDPEGLMGILSGVLVVQAGAHATRIMLSYNHARTKRSISVHRQRTSQETLPIILVHAGTDSRAAVDNTRRRHVDLAGRRCRAV